ncbi:MAG: glycosyltransferase family 2 protein [Candidatus Omnitrophica bacterium]|nr:glycosyltransferase family 2 protein [Candidatus Omnitrophota bacterium]
MDISVVIPVYNEEDNIEELTDELSKALSATGKSHEILVVNDGSTDNTQSRLKKIHIPGMTVISMTRNFGQTPAIMAGFHHAKGDVIVTMDGDLQNDPNDIPKLLEKIDEGYDLVCGWRKERKDNFFLRTIPSMAANSLIGLMLKTNLHDYGCTLKAFKRAIVQNLNLYGEMHRFIPAIAVWHGANITEIEVNHRPRIHGKTKYGINRVIRVFLDLLLVAFLSEYSTKPIRFFGGLSILSGLLSFISLVFVAFTKIFKGEDMTGNPMLILCVLFFLVGVQLLSIGFLGEINIRTYYESQNKKTYLIKEIIV